MAFEVPADLMVGVSGVRGRVGEALTPEVVARFASAFGAYIRERRGDRPRILLARDSRTSGEMFARVAGASLQSVGCDVIEIGVVPTPTALFNIRQLEADGAIVVTASHNPVEWNALKLASWEGMFLDAEDGPRMRAYISDKAIPRAGWDTLGALKRDDAAARRHLDAVLSLPFLDRKAMRARRLKVVLDCVNGAGSTLLLPLLEELGCEIAGMNLEPHGRFPREPEPIAQNLGAVEAKVRETGADIGIVTDPDADRVSLVSDAGSAIGEDYTLALAAMLVLQHRKGPVVTNLSTSRIVEDVATRAGVPFHRAAVGEINVVRAMQKHGATIGGEGNGGVILPDVQYTRDSAVASALVLQLLAESGKKLSEIVASLPAYAIVKDKLPRGAGELGPVYDTLVAELGAPVEDRQDGLWLGWPDARRWLHFRPSGTEPILRIIAEASAEAEARELVARARAALPAAG